MTEKELLKQLNKLTTINADANFKAANRQLLMAQITQGEAVRGLNSLARLNIFMSRLFQPYAVAIMIALFFVASAAWGWNISRQAKPGDSLYLAKKISERTKMLVAMDEASRVRLNLEFASNRAQEMNFLRQDNNQTETTSAQAGLTSDFKREISQVKDRLAKINVTGKQNKSSKSDFNSAETGKDNVRIDVSVPDKKLATSTATAEGIGEVLEEAQKLFDDGAYDKVVDKLGEANQLIDQTAN